MATPEEMFRTAKFGGYDKDDVEQEIQRLNDAAMVEKNELKGKLDQANAKIRAQAQELEVRSAKIKELQDALIAKDTELQNVEKEVKDKYQSYVDNYDTIGSLIYEAKIRAKQVDRETEAQRQRILAEANAEAIRRALHDTNNTKLRSPKRIAELLGYEGKTEDSTITPLGLRTLSNVSVVRRGMADKIVGEYGSLSELMDDIEQNPDRLDDLGVDNPAILADSLYRMWGKRA